MKKVKLILTAITAIGLAGGALAYKAKKYGTTKYCYTTTTDAGARCCLTVNNAIMLGGSPQIKYVTIPSFRSCSDWPLCTKTAHTFGL